ncbi:MAG: S8 family serine peptidase [Chloroflexi bacterium]|nr:S8 family serine peptidase [Chloroflexota bacterium]
MKVPLFRLERLIQFVLVFALILVSFPGFPARAADDSPGYAPDRILVKFKPGTSAAVRKGVNAARGGRAARRIGGIDVDVVAVSGDPQEFLAAYRTDPSVRYAELDYTARAVATPNDAYLPNQWALAKVQAFDGWDVTSGSPAVKLAILDSGIDQDHEDLASKIVDNYNATAEPTLDDLYGHGTSVAGAAAAVTDNGAGIAGMAPGVSLMNIKVLNQTGGSYDSWIADGIIWAVDHGARVISMSLITPNYSSTLEEAVNYAWNRGAVVVAAAGNTGSSSPAYPAAYANSIAVAATDANDVKAAFSNYGGWVDIAAPGVQIFSTLPNHPNAFGLNYGYAGGTSMATAMVSGLAALLWSTPTGTTNAAVRSRIEATADQVSGTGTYWQNGRINAYRAVSTITGYGLSINVVGTGTVTKNPDQAAYAAGAVVSLTAVPGSGWAFSGWSGDLGGGSNPATITMTGNKTVTVAFTASAPLLTRYENAAGINAVDLLAGAGWKGQTFTPRETHKVTRVSIPFLRQGNPSGDVVAGIRATDASGRPAGADLASGSIPAGSIPASWSLAWYNFDLGAGVTLVAGAKYAIVMRAPGADAASPVYYGADTSGDYARGWAVYGSGGSGWSDIADKAWDFAFEELGVPGTPPANRPPVLSPIGNRAGTVNQLLTFNVSATDADNNPLVFTAGNLPPGASFNAATRAFSWTPGAPGTYQGVHFEVSDGMLSVSEDITITITDSAPSSLHESYRSFNGADVFYGPYWRAQAFTPPVGYDIIRVRLPLVRAGVPAGDVIVSIRETDAAGLPAGPDLASASLPAGSVNAAWTESWHDFNLAGGYRLTAGKRYALVWRAPGAGAAAPIYFLLDTAGRYTGGSVATSADGATWSSAGTQSWDAEFETWGTGGG